MYLFPVNVLDCMSIIGSLKVNEQNVHSFPVPIFKSFATSFEDLLCDLINLKFLDDIFPDSFRKAYTTRIFKKGDKYNITNFQPISLLSLSELNF